MIFVNMSNIVIMEDVLSKLSKYKRNNSYVDVAKNYIKSAILMFSKAEDKFRNFENELNGLKKDLVGKSHLDFDQNQKLLELSNNLKEKHILDNKQNYKIDDLFKLVESEAPTTLKGRGF